jgi:H+/Cl- antiporter ClcA
MDSYLRFNINTIGGYSFISFNLMAAQREQVHGSLWPTGGLVIGLGYYYYGKEVVKKIYYRIDHSTIRLKWSFCKLVGTIITHRFCGGSAGREGTAVQMEAQ